uniref:RRM domain-containing protein n=1 Tax=Pseudo-nitzschia australis TaxID=44445 RepID=A0A7S4ARJ5_9STRA
MQKSMENTVFVRFEPTPQHKVMRHELEDIFSQAGPIKKSSWINTKGAVAPSGDGENYQRGTTDRSSKGYGFIKYIAQEDAIAAQKDLNNSRIQMEGKNYTLKVKLASASAAADSKNAKANFRGEKKKDESSEAGAGSAAAGTTSQEALDEAALLKKKSRIILRNLSFYAKENHIRKVMESNYGKVSDIHVPKVKNNLHVGFCFVTFQNPKDAQKAVDGKSVDIQKRAVTMAWSLPKKLHQQQKQQQKQEQEMEKQKQKQKQKDLARKKEEDDEAESVKTNSSDDDDGSNSDNSNDGSNSDSDNDDDSDSDGSEADEQDNDSMEEDSDADEDSEEEEKEEPVDDSVGKKCCLFLRNLPFDTTRNDIFELLYKFGHIKGIYLVKDRETNMLKGTAFVTYSKPQGARRAMEFAASSSTGTPFVSQRQNAGRSNEGGDDASQIRGSLTLKGRKILVDMAVDKETAATFDSKEYKIPQADRRNFYLQAEARVESSSTDPTANNTDTWDDLPQQDQRKRQTALKDKTAKLQSPIFFINPNRLSFRNMGKQVDEAGLQKLIELATKRGLEKKLATAEDQIAHWRALGEMSTREILAKVQEIEGKNLDVIPTWSYDDDHEIDIKGEKKKRRKNIKDFIPSVYIDRDFGPNGKKTDAPSRGFGFAEFTHHTHALACLRELNNNAMYSKDYAAGGKAAAALKKAPKKRSKKGAKVSAGDYQDEEGRVHVPRLIVDFVVENKVKAKKQAERRLHQQLNQSKQHLDKLEKNKAKKEAGEGDDANNKRRGRGAIQREKKRLKRESGEEEKERQMKLQKKAMYEAKKELRKERAEEKKRKAEELKRKSMKPPKKKKSQLKKIEDDEEFESIVRTYQSKLESSREEKAPKENPRKSVESKRWFE